MAGNQPDVRVRMRAEGSRVLIDWSVLRDVPPGREGEPRGSCESCGLFLWCEAAYKLPGLPGRHCSVRCVEFELAQRRACHWCFAEGEPAGTRRRYCNDTCRKQSLDVPLGDGTRLLRFLSRRHPAVYERAISGSQVAPMAAQAACLACGRPLRDKRRDAQFHGSACRMRYARANVNSDPTKTSQNGANNAHTPIENKELTEAQIGS